MESKTVEERCIFLFWGHISPTASTAVPLLGGMVAQKQREDVRRRVGPRIFRSPSDTIRLLTSSAVIGTRMLFLCRKKIWGGLAGGR